MITVGDYVYYDSMSGIVDTVIGIVMEIDERGTLKIQWFDGFTEWYGPFGIVKV